MLGCRFTPSGSGKVEQTLSVSADSPGSGSIELTGSGIQGELTLDPTSINFGDVLIGNVSGEATVQLSNFGTASLDATELTAPNGDFARSGGTCSETLPITIAASGHCLLRYTYSPSVVGQAGQTLTVGADAPGGGSIELSGTSIEGSPVIDPSLIDFGTITVGDINTLGIVAVGNERVADVTKPRRPWQTFLSPAPRRATAVTSCPSSLSRVAVARSPARLRLPRQDLHSRT